jgi:hypothetical protein
MAARSLQSGRGSLSQLDDSLANRCQADTPGSLRSGLTREKHAEVFVEEDVDVRDDRAPGYLPRTLYLAQHILAASLEEPVIGLQVRAVRQKRGPGLDLLVCGSRGYSARWNHGRCS